MRHSLKYYPEDSTAIEQGLQVKTENSANFLDLELDRSLQTAVITIVNTRQFLFVMVANRPACNMPAELNKFNTKVN
jgi:hypothetical protein